MILAQLWTSKGIFRESDGTNDSLLLRCRNRLGMSLIFDCFRWWRQTFAGLPDPYEENEGTLQAFVTDLYIMLLKLYLRLF
jgi:hypothetical protein